MNDSAEALANSSSFIRIERLDRVVIVTLDRGDGRNALNQACMIQLLDTAMELGRNADLAAVILRGEGVFSAGVDVAGFADSGARLTPSKVELREQLRLGPALCKAWEEIEAFTIAAIEGYCVGGAAALAAALDYRVLGASAFFRLPEVPLGMNMSWQTIPRLVAQIGPARTKQYVILGHRVPAPQALAWGLCEAVVADGGTLAAAMVLVDDLKRLPPLPVRMTKQAINATANALNHVASYMDRDQYLLTAQTKDCAEAVAAFLEKRPPNFTGQ